MLVTAECSNVPTKKGNYEYGLFNQQTGLYIHLLVQQFMQDVEKTQDKFVNHTILLCSKILDHVDTCALTHGRFCVISCQKMD